MIDGLRLTISGEELRLLLEQRIDEHQRCKDQWTRERDRTPEEHTEEAPLLPDHMCEHEAERHEWRADVLGFMRDHIDSGEVYRLGEADLLFGELLPSKPGWLEQEEDEERTSVGFHPGRLAKNVGSRFLSRVAAALDGRAMFVVSGDPDLLDVEQYEGVRIVSPRQFLAA